MKKIKKSEGKKHKVIHLHFQKYWKYFQSIKTNKGQKNDNRFVQRKSKNMEEDNTLKLCYSISSNLILALETEK